MISLKAIAGVNMVYAAAMMGEWDRVNVMLGRLKSFYSPELNCQVNSVLVAPGSMSGMNNSVT